MSDEKTAEHPDYVTMSSGLRGTFAVLMVWRDGYYEPWQTGFLTGEAAHKEAEEWAKDEGIEFRP